jgi:hypothetical protein
VLARLFNLGREEGIRLVDFSQTVEHLGELGRCDRLDGDFEDRLGDVADRRKDVEVVFERRVDDRGRFRDGSVDARKEDKVSSTGFLDIDSVPERQLALALTTCAK